MNEPTIEFKFPVWPQVSSMLLPDEAPERATAEIVLPKGLRQFQGSVLASRVSHRDASYMILEPTESPSYWMDESQAEATYLAFRSDVDVNPTEREYPDRPEIMFRAVMLESYDRKPFWGWEAHTPTPGEGWYLIRGQHIEERTAPASQWAEEIQSSLLPQLEARLKRFPQLLERCERIVVARHSMYPDDLEEISDLKKHLSTPSPQFSPDSVSHQDLAENNLVSLHGHAWRSEEPEPDLEKRIRNFDGEIPCLQRRVIQAQWLVGALRFLGNQPVEMKRTMLHAERRFSLPVPVHPLSVVVKNTIRPAARIRMR